MQQETMVSRFAHFFGQKMNGIAPSWAKNGEKTVFFAQ